MSRKLKHVSLVYISGTSQTVPYINMDLMRIYKKKHKIMKNVSHFDEFLNEGMTPDTNITVRTPKYSGPVRFPSMVEYLALSTKYANDTKTNFGQAKKVMLLKKKSKDGVTEGVKMLRLFKEILEDLKMADSSTYSKIGGDTLVGKIKTAFTPLVSPNKDSTKGTLAKSKPKMNWDDESQISNLPTTKAFDSGF